MSEQMITIEGKVREKTGKSMTRKLRKEGWLPANILHKGTSTSIGINPYQLDKAFANNRTFTLKVDNLSRTVKVSEVQIHPVRRTPLHLDLVVVE